MILSKSRKDKLREQLRYFQNLVRNSDYRTTVAERIAINNMCITICDVLCIESKTDAQYLNDLRGAPRTEYKFNKEEQNE